MDESIDSSKRHFVQTGLFASGLLLANPSLALAGGLGRQPKMKELAFRNLHTDEQLRVTYWKNGSYDRGALSRIHRIMRDFRTGDVFPISANLIDLLHDLQAKMRTDATIEIISGYRSPKTNAMLVNNSDGVAKRSYHMRGLATDIRMSSVPLRKIQTTALFMKRGGVGFYPNSDFVHVDVGPVRHWG
ncbi:MAG: DUF882 domain-containing protein [Proteobacteria bacterium]|jgi:uncharacterized protein YcbK (DUF882 family)|nr:DUF882 domain-containing protein [Alphaproteobacteria bacterium]NCC02718.1 DUF882 domain-containing protein [Pseudomonadota bacterium]